MKELYFNKPAGKDLEKIKDMLAESLSEEKAFRKVFLACEEIFVNIISYSGAQNAAVRMEEDAGHITVTFSDDGISFDPTRHYSDKEFSELDTGGMGISLVRDIAEKMQYKRENKKNILKLIFKG